MWGWVSPEETPATEKDKRPTSDRSNKKDAKALKAENEKLKAGLSQSPREAFLIH